MEEKTMEEDEALKKEEESKRMKGEDYGRIL